MTERRTRLTLRHKLVCSALVDALEQVHIANPKPRTMAQLAAWNDAELILESPCMEVLKALCAAQRAFPEPKTRAQIVAWSAAEDAIQDYARIVHQAEDR
jgi:hypothetical protein